MALMTVNNANQYLPPSPVIPMALAITNITNSYPMVVTVQGDNTYVLGQLVTLSVPNSYGMFQANGLKGMVLTSVGQTISLNLNSIPFDLFVTPANPTQTPSLSPSGARNIYNITQVPFHSENGLIGN